MTPPLDIDVLDRMRELAISFRITGGTKHENELAQNVLALLAELRAAMERAVTSAEDEAAVWRGMILMDERAEREWGHAKEDFSADDAASLVTRLIQERDAARERNAELTAALSGMVGQHCTMADGTLNSCALSANAEAIELLADAGQIELAGSSFGRMVVGKWKEAR